MAAQDRSLKGFARRGVAYGFVMTDEEITAAELIDDLEVAKRDANVERAEAEVADVEWLKNEKAFDIAATLSAGKYVKQWDEPRPDQEGALHKMQVVASAYKMALEEFSDLLLGAPDFLDRVEETLWPILSGAKLTEDISLKDARSLEAMIPAVTEIVNVLSEAHGKRLGVLDFDRKALRLSIKDAESEVMPRLSLILEERKEKQLEAATSIQDIRNEKKERQIRENMVNRRRLNTAADAATEDKTDELEK